jgi:hypothetical protein
LSSHVEEVWCFRRGMVEPDDCTRKVLQRGTSTGEFGCCFVDKEELNISCGTHYNICDEELVAVLN